MSDPLALGATLYSEPSLCASAALTEEAIWIFGQDAVGTLSSPSERKVTKSVAFPDGGLYVMASGSSQMLIDAGPHGWGSGGHGHADALSVRLSVDGRRWLVDPGSYLYIASKDEPNWRDQFRGTAAHNTLRVDGLDQAIPRSPFSWTSLPDVYTDEWQTTSQYDFFDGAHQGYMRLGEPVLHRRKIFHLRDEYWLVLDTTSGKGIHDLEIFWHFAPGLQVSEFEEGLTASHPSGESLVLLGAAKARWTAATEQGCISPVYGDKRPATVGIFRSSRVPVPAEHATLLLSSQSGEEPGIFRCLGATEGATAYSFERDDITDTIVFAPEGPAWEFGPFRSHAPFFFARTRAGEVELVIMKGVAHAEWNGQPFFRSEDDIRIPWLHWSKNEGAFDPKLLKFFDPEVLRAKTPVPLKQ
jgi:hypothetical protein